MKRNFFWLLLFFITAGVTSVAAAEPIVVYDITHFRNSATGSNSLEYYDRMVAIQTLAGIVNRDSPKLFLDLKKGYEDHYSGPIIDFDLRWFEKLCSPSNHNVCVSSYSQLNGRPIEWLSETTVPVESLVNRYKSLVNGLVVWDKRVNATSNAAITIAGADNRIAVKYAPDSENSLLKRIKNTSGLTEKINLYQLDFTDPNRVPDGVAATGSVKNNVYRWLVEKYLKTGKVNPQYIGYYIDAYSAEVGESFYIKGLSHIDWMVKKRGLVFDLSPWGDEKPVDDQSQPMGADRDGFVNILTAARGRFSEVGLGHGFIPWPFKYSKYKSAGNHESYLGEHEYINLFSENGYVVVSSDAESNCCNDEIGDMANASFYSNLDNGAERKFLNDNLNLPAQVPELENKTYLLFGAGDYDSASWNYKILTSPKFLGGQNRPDVPVFWWITPGVFEENPVLLDEMIKNRKSTDYFGAEYGIGYYNARLFPDNLKDKLLAETIKQYRRLNFSITGFVIPADDARGSRQISEAEKRLLTGYSPDGLGMATDDSGEAEKLLYGRVPVYKISSYLENNVDTAVNQINRLAGDSGSRFVYVRGVLMYPETMNQILQKLKSNYGDKNWQAVDPYTFFRLLGKSLNGENAGKYRATYLSDTVPATLEPGKDYSVSVTIRNDGSDTWINTDPENKTYNFVKSLTKRGEIHDWNSYNSFGRDRLPKNVAPGEQVTVNFSLKGPDLPGDYELEFDMMRESIGGFREQGDIPWLKSIKVVSGGPSCQVCTNGKDKSKGDANCDGKVDLVDFGMWKAGNIEADFDCDANVTIKDFGKWKEGFRAGS